MERIRRSPGVTRIDAEPVTAPVSVATLATIVPAPRTRPAVKTTPPLASADSVPKTRGVSDHEGVTSTALPKTSAPVTVSRRDARARTVARAGWTARRVTGPGV